MPKLTPNKPTQKKSGGRESQKISKTAISNTAIGSSLPASRLSSFIPSQMRASHKYVDNFIITGGAAGVLGASFDYSLTGMFDPYLGAGGHQPYGFDQLTPWFGIYIVESVDVTVTLLAPSTAQTYLSVAWRPSAGSFTIAGLGVNDVGEKDNMRWLHVPQAPAKSSDSTTKIGKFLIHKVEGSTKQICLTEDDYQGTATSNPGRQPRLMFALGDIGGGSASTCQIVVQLEYHTLWRQRKTVTGS